MLYFSLITPPLTSKNEIIQYTYLVKESTWHKFNSEMMEERERESNNIKVSTSIIEFEENERATI